MSSIPKSKITGFTNFNHIYQIYYSEKTKKQLYDCFQPLHNKHLSPFFENTPILEVYHKHFPQINDNEWVGVLSPKFFQKAQSIGGKTVSGRELDKLLSKTDKDVIGFHIKMTNLNIITQADNYHKDFTKVFKLILEKADIDYDVRIRSRKLFKLPSGHWVYPNIFSNAVIARKWVYKKYIKEVLKPCYEVMSDPNNEEIRNIIWRNSGYNRLVYRSNSQYLKRQIGVPYYPYHTFICERFWTMFLNMNKEIKVTQYPYE